MQNDQIRHEIFCAVCVHESILLISQGGGCQHTLSLFFPILYCFFLFSSPSPSDYFFSSFIFFHLIILHLLPLFLVQEELQEYGAALISSNSSFKASSLAPFLSFNGLCKYSHFGKLIHYFSL